MKLNIELHQQPWCCFSHHNIQIDTDFADELDRPDWWLPGEIRIVESIPKTATGTSDKKGLRECAAVVLMNE